MYHIIIIIYSVILYARQAGTTTTVTIYDCDEIKIIKQRNLILKVT